MSRGNETVLWAIDILRRYAPHPCADESPERAATAVTSTPQDERCLAKPETAGLVRPFEDVQ
jgi:hypothetical protein